MKKRKKRKKKIKYNIYKNKVLYYKICKIYFSFNALTYIYN